MTVKFPHSPDIPPNETERLAALHALKVLDTAAEARFDRITRVAQRHFDAPIALVSLVDEGRQWFKSCQGLDATETSRDISFCGHAILNDAILVVPDATEDLRFVDNPLVTGSPNIRFYAGAPLHAPGGERVGTLCIIDTRPRAFSAEDIAMLRDLADCVEEELVRVLLQDSEQRVRSAQTALKALINAVVDGIVTIDHWGVIQSFNPAAERLFGYAEAEVIGHNVKMLMPEPYRGQHDGYLQNFLTTGTRKIIGINREVMGQRRDASTFPMELSVSEILVNGESMFVGIVRDITRRKELQRVQLQQQAILQSSDDAIISKTLAGIIDSWNPGAERIFGYRADEVIGRPMAQVFPDERMDEEVEMLAKVARGEMADHVETTRRRKDGSLIDVSVTISPVIDEHGIVIGVSKIARDITERQRMIAILTEERRRLSDVLEGANVGTWEWNLQTGELALDERSAGLIGFGLAELMPASMETWFNRTHPEDLERTERLLKEHRVGQSERYECDARLRHKDGHWVWLRTSGRLSSRPTDGKPLLISGTHQDITAQKQRQAIRAEMLALSEAANVEKTMFLATMSHEIRSPLNAILGLAYLLEQNNLDRVAREMVRKIRSAGNMLLGSVSAILDIAKIEAGQLELEQAPFDLETIVDNVATTLGTAIGEKAIELTVAPLPAGVRSIVGDAARVQMVLTNLASNAAKFTQAGSIAVGIELLSRADGSDWLRFSVRDTGIGISPERQSTVFDAFAPADLSTNRLFGGAGLGLAICRETVKLMGGEIGLISAPGQGSEFWFTLPLQRVAAAQDSSSNRVALKILIVDDSEIELEALGGVAQQLGWRVHKVDSGAGALAWLKVNNRAGYPHVIVIDWKMPGMDGLALARSIRASQAQDVCAIVIMATAQPLASLVNQVDAELVDAFLAKPVTESALYNAVLAAQRHRSSSQGSAPSHLAGGSLPLEGVRLLVVDDNDMNREVAQGILGRLGATVNLAEGGREATDWLLAHPFDVDLVLMDVLMPVLDGIETTRLLRRMPQFDDLPIVGLSAGVLQSQQKAAMAVGMTEFILKPFDVRLTVDLILRLRRPSRLLPAKPATASLNAVLMPSGALAVASRATGVMDTQQALGNWLDLLSYQTYLRRFAVSYGDAIALLGTLLVADDRTGAAALAHQISGVAANLALLDTRCAAQALEALLHTQEDPGQALADLSKALAAVMAEIDRYAPPIEQDKETVDTTHVAAPPLSATARIALQKQLTQLLLALDSDNPVLIKRVMTTLEPQLPAPALSAIVDSVLGYDFRAAKAHTRQLALDYAIDLGR